MMIQKQKEVVEITRYIRPNALLDDNPFTKANYGYHNNLYGITVVYTVDYNTQKVKAQWSICNGDNFEKYRGKALARHSNSVVHFDLQKVKDEGSLTEALIFHLENFVSDYPYVSDFEDTLELFLKASRKLKNKNT